MSKDNKHIYLILFGLSLTIFLSNFDVNALNLALVSIQSDLSLSLGTTEWILNGYLLTFASLLLISGRLSDLFGHKRLILVGITLFILASIFAGLSQKGWQLVACRTLQGMGTAFFWPGTQSVIYLIFPKEKKVLALGILLAVAGIALALGPVVSGLILTFLDWRWIFFINVPICLFSFLVIYFAYHEKPSEEKQASLDLTGLVYLLIFAFSLIYSVTLLGQKQIPWLAVLAFLILSIFFLGFYVGHEKRTMYPLIPMSHFQNKPFVKSVCLRSSLMFAFIAILFLTSFYLQQFLHLKPWVSGLYFLPITLSFGLGSFLGSKIIHKIPLIKMIHIGGLIAAFGIFCLGFLSPEYMTFSYILIPTILFGLGFGTFAPLNNYYTMQTLPTTFVGFGISFTYMVGLIGSSLSISLCGIFITKLGWFNFAKSLDMQGIPISPALKDSALNILSGTQNLATLPGFAEELKNAFFFSYQMDMFLCALLIVIAFFTIRLTENPSIDYNP